MNFKSTHAELAQGQGRGWDTEIPDWSVQMTTRSMKKHLRTAERKLSALQHAVEEIRIRSSLPAMSVIEWDKTDPKLLDSPYLQPLASADLQGSRTRALPTTFWQWVETGLTLYLDITQELKAFARDGIEALLKDKEIEEAYIRKIKLSFEAEIFRYKDKDMADISAVIDVLKSAVKEKIKKLRKKQKKKQIISSKKHSGRARRKIKKRRKDTVAVENIVYVEEL